MNATMPLVVVPRTRLLPQAEVTLVLTREIARSTIATSNAAGRPVFVASLEPDIPGGPLTGVGTVAEVITTAAFEANRWPRASRHEDRALLRGLMRGRIANVDDRTSEAEGREIVVEMLPEPPEATTAEARDRLARAVDKYFRESTMSSVSAQRFVPTDDGIALAYRTADHISLRARARQRLLEMEGAVRKLALLEDWISEECELAAFEAGIVKRLGPARPTHERR